VGRERRTNEVPETKIVSSSYEDQGDAAPHQCTSSRPLEPSRSDDPSDVFEVGTVVKVLGLTDPTSKLARKHRTSIHRAQIVSYHAETSTYEVMPMSEAKRLRTDVPARALLDVCCTGAEELSFRGGRLDCVEKKKRVDEQRRMRECEKKLDAAVKMADKERHRRLDAEAAASKAAAAAAALLRGDAAEPSLTRAGKAAAAATTRCA